MNFCRSTNFDLPIFNFRFPSARSLSLSSLQRARTFSAMAAFRRNPRNFFSTITHTPPASSSSSIGTTNSTSTLTRRRFKSVIVSSSDPDKIYSILHSAPDNHLLRDRETTKIALSKLGRSGRTDLVEQLLGRVRSSLDTADEKGLLRVMRMFSYAGMVDNAVSIFHEIPNRTEKSLCALLGVLVDNHLPGRARESFLRVPAEIGIVPGISAWNLHLKALCDDGDITTAAELVLGKLQSENNIEPDIFSHNVLLDAYRKKGDESGFNVIVEAIIEKGLHQDTVTYNNRIAMLCRNGNRADDAEKLFDEMLSKGLKPNFITYNNVLAGFCKCGDLISAVRWFGRMRDQQALGGVAIDGGSYVIIMKLMVEKGEIRQAVEMCKESLGKKWTPPFDVIRALVDGLVKDSKANEARNIVEMMRGCVKGPALVAWIKFESTLPL